MAGLRNRGGRALLPFYGIRKVKEGPVSVQQLVSSASSHCVRPLLLLALRILLPQEAHDTERSGPNHQWSSHAAVSPLAVYSPPAVHRAGSRETSTVSSVGAAQI